MEPLQTELMSIGRFARLTGLTVKGLRHYDEVGLLRPAAVDPRTGYRSYDAGQAGTARAIRMLRRLEFSLEDVATLLVASDPELIRRILVDHQRRMATRVAELNVVRQGLQRLIDGKDAVMDTKAELLDAETHRRLGSDLFNKTWTLMEKKGRTAEDDDEMIHCAHASAYHWLQVGTAANRARSEWQCSRVYTVLGRAEPALEHAQRCLAICEGEPAAMSDWDLPFAYEALARAHAVAGNVDEMASSLERARALGAEILDPDDRALLESDLETIRT